MRKRTIKHLFDNIFWYVVYLLPVIFCMFTWKSSDVAVSIIMVFDNMVAGFAISPSNIIFQCLYTLFGPTGILPLFADSGIILVCTYFISCLIIHLAVDVLLFLVRWAHNMMEGFLGGKHD